MHKNLLENRLIFLIKILKKIRPLNIQNVTYWYFYILLQIIYYGHIIIRIITGLVVNQIFRPSTLVLPPGLVITQLYMNFPTFRLFLYKYNYE